MSTPHYVAQKVGDHYVLVRQDVGCELEFLAGGALSIALSITQRGWRRGLLISAGTALLAKGIAQARGSRTGAASSASVRRFKRGPSYRNENDGLRPRQKPIDAIEEASMESFPASDPPAH